MLKVLDLFSGIGGFSLGLERTGGFKAVAFCEIEAYPRRVLAKHWPGVPIYDDVRTLTAERLAADGIGVDVICGGFPCQDISAAGGRVGITGERSGLWSEYERLIGEIQPRLVIVENVRNLLSGGNGAWFGRVLGGLAALRYDAWWDCIPASAVGAPHIRDRVWIVAYPDRGDDRRAANDRAVPSGTGTFPGEERRQDGQWRWPGLGDGGEVALGNAGCARLTDIQGRQAWPQLSRFRASVSAGIDGRGRDGWSAEPDVGRVVDGLSRRLDAVRVACNRALGNAVVPQIPELIGRAILARAA